MVQTSTCYLHYLAHCRSAHNRAAQYSSTQSHLQTVPKNGAIAHFWLYLSNFSTASNNFLAQKVVLVLYSSQWRWPGHDDKMTSVRHKQQLQTRSRCFIGCCMSRIRSLCAMLLCLDRWCALTFSSRWYRWNYGFCYKVTGVYGSLPGSAMTSRSIISLQRHRRWQDKTR